MASSSTNSSNNQNDGDKQPSTVSTDKKPGSSISSSVPEVTIVQQHTTRIVQDPEGNIIDEVLLHRMKMSESAFCRPVPRAMARAKFDVESSVEPQGFSDMIVRARPFEEIKMPDTMSDGSTTKPPGSN